MRASATRMARRGGAVVVLALLACSAPLRTATAGTLDDLRSQLAEWKATQEVSATLEWTYARQDHTDTADSVPATSLAVPAHAGRDGVAIRWTPELLTRMRSERGQVDPDAKRPSVEGSNRVTAEAVGDFLDAAPSLLRWLRQATLLSEREVTLDGHPARLLELKLDVPLSAKNRKYVNSVDASLQLWLDGDGVPLAADRRIALKGRALLVIGFEQVDQEHFRFRRVGDRLLVLEHREESRGSGGGESGTTTSSMSLKLDQ